MLSVVYQTNTLFKGSIRLTQHNKLVENKQKLVLALLKLSNFLFWALPTICTNYEWNRLKYVTIIL